MRTKCRQIEYIMKRNRKLPIRFTSFSEGANKTVLFLFFVKLFQCIVFQSNITCSVTSVVCHLNCDTHNGMILFSFHTRISVVLFSFLRRCPKFHSVAAITKQLLHMLFEPETSQKIMQNQRDQRIDTVGVKQSTN